MAHPNEEIARRAWTAFVDRDMEGVEQTFADDVVYHLGGNMRTSGTRTGIDALMGIENTIPDFEPSFELHDLLANDEHAVMLFRVDHEREGKGTLNAPGVWVTHIDAGKITEIWSFPFDQDAAREFLS